MIQDTRFNLWTRNLCKVRNLLSNYHTGLLDSEGKSAVKSVSLYLVANPEKTGMENFMSGRVKHVTLSGLKNSSFKILEADGEVREQRKEVK